MTKSFVDTETSSDWSDFYPLHKAAPCSSVLTWAALHWHIRCYDLAVVFTHPSKAGQVKLGWRHRSHWRILRQPRRALQAEQSNVGSKVSVMVFLSWSWIQSARHPCVRGHGIIEWFVLTLKLIQFQAAAMGANLILNTSRDSFMDESSESILCQSETSRPMKSSLITVTRPWSNQGAEKEDGNMIKAPDYRSSALFLCCAVSLWLLAVHCDSISHLQHWNNCLFLPPPQVYLLDHKCWMRGDEIIKPWHSEMMIFRLHTQLQQ